MKKLRKKKVRESSSNFLSITVKNRCWWRWSQWNNLHNFIVVSHDTWDLLAGRKITRVRKKLCVMICVCWNFVNRKWRAEAIKVGEIERSLKVDNDNGKWEVSRNDLIYFHRHRCRLVAMHASNAIQTAMTCFYGCQKSLVMWKKRIRSERVINKLLSS